MLIAFIFDVSEHFQKYYHVGALERDSLGMSEVSRRSEPLVQQESHGHSLGSRPICCHIPATCSRTQNEPGLFKQEPQSGFFPLKGVTMMVRFLGKGHANHENHGTTGRPH